MRLAAQGRSLGIHLVLATQRPAGAITAEVQANVSLRIAFRVRDRADSVAVVEDAAAADLSAATPGRAVARGPDGRLVTLPVGHSRAGESARAAPLPRGDPRRTGLLPRRRRTSRRRLRPDVERLGRGSPVNARPRPPRRCSSSGHAPPRRSWRRSSRPTDGRAPSHLVARGCPPCHGTSRRSRCPQRPDAAREDDPLGARLGAAGPANVRARSWRRGRAGRRAGPPAREHAALAPGRWHHGCWRARPAAGGPRRCAASSGRPPAPRTRARCTSTSSTRPRPWPT